MFMDPFTSNEDPDSMTILDAQYRAEEETDNFTLTKMEDSTMATTAKKIVKKGAASAAKPAAAKPAAPSAEKKAPAAKRGAAPGPRAVPEGHIGLAQLATEFNTSTAAIRRKLRDSDLTKPEGGWSFKDGGKDLAAVRKLLTPKAKEAAE
jgi:hypothetical protein